MSEEIKDTADTTEIKTEEDCYMVAFCCYIQGINHPLVSNLYITFAKGTKLSPSLIDEVTSMLAYDLDTDNVHITSIIKLESSEGLENCTPSQELQRKTKGGKVVSIDFNTRKIKTETKDES